MSLPLPRLDNRNFDQLVEEGLALIPRHAPEWTDYNWHDPGITLLDLFAWLVEMDMYQLDRTPQTAARAFLRLVGIDPKPPSVAETILVFNVQDGQPSTDLPSGFLVSSSDDQIQFQTTRKLFISKAHLVSVLAGSETSPTDVTVSNQLHNRSFSPFGSDARPGQALYLGFDSVPGNAKDEISMYVWANSVVQDSGLRDRLITEHKWEPTAVARCEQPVPCPRADWREHFSVRTAWEYFSATGWLPLVDVIDETRALTLSGAIRFRFPEPVTPQKGAMAKHPDLFFIRCRLLEGYYECPPEIGHIALNAVPARHAVDVIENNPPKSNGCAGQSFYLSYMPVVARSTHLTIDGEKEAWQEALSWDRVGPHDRSYVLIPETGQILFGNGLHGRVPTDRSQIQIRYQHGGGPMGNVRAGTLSKLSKLADAISVEQRFDATGGEAAETLSQAKARALAWISNPQRAVTLEDFERFTLEMPGVPVKRVQALADYDPTLPGVPALGSVTVIVVPSCANPIPEPGPDLLASITDYLDRRRLVTTEMHVISASFVMVAVAATLHSSRPMDASHLILEAQSRLNMFLDPLHGGTDGQGWPFGRDVYESEVMALLNAIPGVDYVDQVGLIVESELEVYQGYVTWRQNFKRGTSTLTVRAQFRIEPHQVASRVASDAAQAIQEYFDSRRGLSNHVSQKARREDITAILSMIPGVFKIEEIKLDDEQEAVALCGNISMCAHSLVIPGHHELRMDGADPCTPAQVCKPPC
jgi:predicted phage baseplate assembly protein